MYAINYTLCTGHYKLFTIHSTQCKNTLHAVYKNYLNSTVYNTINTVNNTFNTVHNTFNPSHYTLYTMNNILYIVYNAL